MSVPKPAFFRGPECPGFLPFLELFYVQKSASYLDVLRFPSMYARNRVLTFHDRQKELQDTEDGAGSSLCFTAVDMACTLCVVLGQL